MTDILFEGHDLPPSAPWLDDTVSDQAVRVVQRALADAFIVERGTNRGARIDAYNRHAGAPIGSAYCASGLYAWWTWAGVEGPPKAGDAYWSTIGRGGLGPASTDAWYWWARDTKRWMPVGHPLVHLVSPGWAALYGSGKPNDPCYHIECVIRVPDLAAPGGAPSRSWCTFGANTSRAGASRREGEAFDRKWFDDRTALARAGILGFVSLTPIQGGTT